MLHVSHDGLFRIANRVDDGLCELVEFGILLVGHA